MEKEENKTSVLFKELDLAFVYICIFVVGMAIVLTMTTYLNSKVKEFSVDATVSTSK